MIILDAGQSVRHPFVLCKTQSNERELFIKQKNYKEKQKK